MGLLTSDDQDFSDDEELLTSSENDNLILLSKNRDAILSAVESNQTLSTPWDTSTLNNPGSYLFESVSEKPNSNINKITSHYSTVFTESSNISKINLLTADSEATPSQIEHTLRDFQKPSVSIPETSRKIHDDFRKSNRKKLRNSLIHPAMRVWNLLRNDREIFKGIKLAGSILLIFLVINTAGVYLFNKKINTGKPDFVGTNENINIDFLSKKIQSIEGSRITISSNSDNIFEINGYIDKNGDYSLNMFFSNIGAKLVRSGGKNLIKIPTVVNSKTLDNVFRKLKTLGIIIESNNYEGDVYRFLQASYFQKIIPELGVTLSEKFNQAASVSLKIKNSEVFAKNKDDKFTVEFFDPVTLRKIKKLIFEGHGLSYVLFPFESAPISKEYSHLELLRSKNITTIRTQRNEEKHHVNVDNTYNESNNTESNIYNNQAPYTVPNIPPPSPPKLPPVAPKKQKNKTSPPIVKTPRWNKPIKPGAPPPPRKR